jgi:hypothetical protein
MNQPMQSTESSHSTAITEKQSKANHSGASSPSPFQINPKASNGRSRSSARSAFTPETDELVRRRAAVACEL